MKYNGEYTETYIASIAAQPEEIVLNFSMGKDGKKYIKFGVMQLVRKKNNQSTKRTRWDGFNWQDTYEEGLLKVIRFYENKREH